MYIVARGIVECVGNADTDEEKIVVALGSGKYFGELCILAAIRRTLSVRARTYCNLLMLSKSVMDKWKIVRSLLCSSCCTNVFLLI